MSPLTAALADVRRNIEERDQMRELLRDMLHSVYPLMPILKAHVDATHMVEGFRPKRNTWDDRLQTLKEVMNECESALGSTISHRNLPDALENGAPESPEGSNKSGNIGGAGPGGSHPQGAGQCGADTGAGTVSGTGAAPHRDPFPAPDLRYPADEERCGPGAQGYRCPLRHFCKRYVALRYWDRQDGLTHYRDLLVMSAHPRCTMFDVALGTPEYLIDRAMGIREDHLTYLQAREVFGHDTQIAKAAEELSEAAAAILRWRWWDGQSAESRDQMAAELADAEIMLEQMRLIIPSHEIDFNRAEKLTRLRGRLNEQARK